MTAADYANDRENVIVFMVGNGCPAGKSIALLADTELPFDLDDVEGEVDENGVFEAKNYKFGIGAWDWNFHDWNGNLIYKIQLYTDAAEWERQESETE